MQGREGRRIPGREAKACEALLPVAVHVGLQLADLGVALAECARLPGPRSEEDERVEHLLVEAGCVLQSVAPVLDGRVQARLEGRVQGRVTLQVGEAERHVPGLVLGRHPGLLSHCLEFTT